MEMPKQDCNKMCCGVRLPVMMGLWKKEGGVGMLRLLAACVVVFLQERKIREILWRVFLYTLA